MQWQYLASNIYMDMIDRDELNYLRVLCVNMKLNASNIRDPNFINYAINVIIDDLQKHGCLTNTERTYYSSLCGNAKHFLLSINSLGKECISEINTDDHCAIQTMANFNAIYSGQHIKVRTFKMPIRISKALLNGVSSLNNTSGFNIKNIERTGIKFAGEDWILFDFRKDNESSCQLILVHFSLSLCLTCTSMYTLDNQALRSYAVLFITQLQANLEAFKTLSKVI